MHINFIVFVRTERVEYGVRLCCLKMSYLIVDRIIIDLPLSVTLPKVGGGLVIAIISH